MKKILFIILVIGLPLIGIASPRLFSPPIDIPTDAPYKKAADLVVQNLWMETTYTTKGDKFFPKHIVRRKDLAQTLYNYDAGMVSFYKNMQTIICQNKDNFMNNVQNISNKDAYRGALTAICNEQRPGQNSLRDATFAACQGVSGNTWINPETGAVEPLICPDL
jgi:hypothetical protein